MNTSRIFCLLALAVALSTAPARAVYRDHDREAAGPRQNVHLPFDNHEQAERFFDSLNFLLDSRDGRPPLDVILHHDVVELAGPPRLVAQVLALTGCHGEPDRPGHKHRAGDGASHRKQWLSTWGRHNLGERHGRRNHDREHHDAPDAGCRHDCGEKHQAKCHAGHRHHPHDGCNADCVRECCQHHHHDHETGCCRECSSHHQRNPKADCAGAGDRPCHHEPEPGLELRVFELTFAEAPELVRFLRPFHVGSPAPWTVDADWRTNTIIVRGTPALVDQAAELIHRLDRPGREAAHSRATKLMPLSRASAVEMAELVARLSRTSFEDLTVVADRRSNTVVLCGPEDQVGSAAALVSDLDAKPAARAEKPQRRQKGKAAAKARPAKDKKQPAKDKKQKTKAGKPAKKNKASQDRESRRTQRGDRPGRQVTRPPAPPRAQHPDQVPPARKARPAPAKASATRQSGTDTAPL